MPQGCHLPMHRVPGLGLGQVRFQQLCQLPLEVVAGAGVWTVWMGKQVQAQRLAGEKVGFGIKMTELSH